MIAQKIAQLQAELKEAKRRARQGGGRSIDAAVLARSATKVAAGYAVLLASVDVEDLEALKELSVQIRKQMGSGVIALVRPGESPDLLVTVEGTDASPMNAGEIVAVGARACGGRGGGKPNMGQGRGAEGGDAKAALDAMASLLAVKPAVLG